MDQQKIPDSELMFNQLKLDFKNSFDMKIERVPTNSGEVVLAYVDGMINRDLFNRDVITPLKSDSFAGDIPKSILTSIDKVDDHQKFIIEILNGSLGIYYNGERFISDIRKWEKRSVETPGSENATRGPKEGFTEDLLTNTALLRRKIRNENLVLESRVLGRQSRTKVVIGYVDGIANKEVLALLRERLDQIDIDSVLETGTIEQLIDNKPLIPLSTIGMSQKPDVIASKIMEGRVCLFCDGSPHALYLPELFIENLQRSEDYYHRAPIATFLRIIRFIGFLISVILPGFYVGMATFNPEMLPPSFLVTIISSMEQTPFPEAIEILFLVLMMELLKESGTRLPKALGSAVSIVGALIIGEAAVNAGIVSAPSVIIVALSAVAGFIVPNLNEFTTIYKLIFIIFASLMGIIGLAAVLVIMITQLSAMRSFDIPIMSFFHKNELKDSLLRFPTRHLRFRPASIQRENFKRIGK
ncbi:MAG: spore germination protein [Clostridiales bacterium]|nr:spore germination protein [Clostridiales bacterium]